jgi:hypothetical protein
VLILNEYTAPWVLSLLWLVISHYDPVVNVYILYIYVFWASMLCGFVEVAIVSCIRTIVLVCTCEIYIPYIYIYCIYTVLCN